MITPFTPYSPTSRPASLLKWHAKLLKAGPNVSEEGLKSSGLPLMPLLCR